MAAAASHSNKTAWHLTRRFVRYLSSSHTIRMIYKISYTNYLLLSASFRSCVHCIATRVAMRVVKGSEFSPHSSIFHFEFRSQMNLVSSLFFLRLSASFRSCIHCIATRVAMRVVKGSEFSPRSSIFHFEFRSQMNLVSSLFF